MLSVYSNFGPSLASSEKANVDDEEFKRMEISKKADTLFFGNFSGNFIERENTGDKGYMETVRYSYKILQLPLWFRLSITSFCFCLL